MNSNGKIREWELEAAVVIIVFMELLEEVALGTADHVPTKWLRYIDSTFALWLHGPARQVNFFMTSVASDLL